MIKLDDSSRKGRAFVTLAGLAFALLSGIANAQAPDGMPPPAVVVQQVEIQPIDEQDVFIAQAEAIEAVDIRARVQGFLQEIAFRSGQEVEEGDLLFRIEPDQYEAQLASARAQLSRSEAAQQEAQRTLARTQELVQRQTAARATLDEAQAAADIAAADVEAARAAIRTAELNLSYTEISSPISGYIDRPLFTRGNLVGPDSGTLARIVQLDPIWVTFSLPEDIFVSLRQQAADQGRSLEPEGLRLTLRLPNGSDYPHTGEVDYAASETDVRTGTIPVRLRFPNPDKVILPGQFLTLFIGLENPQELPVVPQSAVLQDRSGRFVYVLQEGNSVTQQRIETGPRVPDGWAVTGGLEGGEEVVVQGIQRLSEGAVVQPSHRSVGDAE